MPVEASEFGQIRPKQSIYLHQRSGEDNSIKRRGRVSWILSLALLLPALAAVIGVVAWAISAEVVMGAKREAARKNNQISTMRLHQTFDNSDDFSINRVNKRIGDSSKLLVSNSETALMREVHKEEQNNNILNDRLTPHNKVFSYDGKHKQDTYILDLDDNQEEVTEAEDENSLTTTKKPVSTVLDLEKIRKTLTGTHVAEVIDRLVAQRKVLNPKEGNVPQIVVVAPAAEQSLKKNKTIATSTKSSTTSSSTTTTTSTTTTSIPTIRRTTLKPMRSMIQSMSLKLSNNVIATATTTTTTTRPKRTKIKTSSIKLKKSTTTTTTTTPSTTSTTTATTTTTTTRKPSSAKQRSRSRKTSSKSSKIGTITTTTTAPTTTLSPAQIEVLKSKIRQRELEFILDKVEKLEKQQKHFLKQSANHDLLMESSFRDNIFKPRSRDIPYKQAYKFDDNPEYNYGFPPQHNYGSHSHGPQNLYDASSSHHNNQMQTSGWQPSPPRTYVAPPAPPPPPPSPPTPPPPPVPAPQPQSHQPMFHPPHNDMQHQQMSGSHQVMSSPNIGVQFNSGPQPPPLLPAQPPPPPQQLPHLLAQPLMPPEQPSIAQRIKKGLKFGNIFNGILPVPKSSRPHNFEPKEPNNRAISLSLGDSHVPQESQVIPYQFEQRGHTAYVPQETPGVQLNFGGGPMGGGGQLITSPMGIFKTLLLPLMPKPRMNLNGKVVFGVVLENGVGFGKKPKVIAQHFSTGHI